MKLSAGTRLGPYEIRAFLGEGAMGEVYRARDVRLGRDVALKILPAAFAADRDRLKRFEEEARAAGGLSHPNVLAIHDLGTDGGTPFVVTELLDGETLGARLARGPLALAKALDYAIQIARGLAAAHEKGVIHRDLKPDNLFLTKDGRIKILDFGLAKLTRPDSDGAGHVSMTTLTSPGMIVGTPGYIAPEQIQGTHPVDARTDVFALGCVLYEMLAGRRPFRGATAVETLAAILREEPPALSEVNPSADVPPAVEQLVRRCLEKDPAERFGSARDLAFALAAVAASRDAPPRGVSWSERLALDRRSAIVAALVAAVALLVWTAAAVITGRRTVHPSQPVFQRLTFQRGKVTNARFAPGGQTIVYSAAWAGGPERVYTTRVEDPASTPLDLPPARLLAVSSRGELAILLAPYNTLTGGTLARVPLGGGGPREVAEHVLAADWSPDGSELAVVRHVAPAGSQAHSTGPDVQLEYPLGHPIYRSETGIWDLRVSPAGDRVAIFEMTTGSVIGRNVVRVVDRRGRARPLTEIWEDVSGLGWTPSGREIWFAAVASGVSRRLYAVSPKGRQRLLLRTPAAVAFDDVSSDGRLLMATEDSRKSIVYVDRDGGEHDLSWLDQSQAVDLSADGRTLLLHEEGEAVGPRFVVCLRETDGSPVVRLGEGYPGGLSPNGRYAVALLFGTTPRLEVLPTGPGEMRVLPRGPVADYAWSDWLPDATHVIFAGNEAGREPRVWSQSIAGGPPHALTPEGVFGGWHTVSPDGKMVISEYQGRQVGFSLEGGAPRPLPGVLPDDWIIRWSPEGTAVYVRNPAPAAPSSIYRVALATGRRTLWRPLMPSDPAGVGDIFTVVMANDPRVFAYSYARTLSNLFLVTGLK